MSYLYSLYDALVSISVPADKARAVVDAMERDMGTTLATKPDLEHLRLATKADLENLRLETRQDIQLLRRDMETLRRDMESGLSRLRSDMENGFARVDEKFEKLDERIDTVNRASRLGLIDPGSVVRRLHPPAPYGTCRGAIAFCAALETALLCGDSERAALRACEGFGLPLEDADRGGAIGAVVGARGAAVGWRFTTGATRVGVDRVGVVRGTAGFATMVPPAELGRPSNARGTPRLGSGSGFAAPVLTRRGSPARGMR